MHDSDKETVLLICGDAADAERIMTDLYDAQIRVIGPIHTARMALAMTAQNDATLALLAGEPTGQRKAPELATALLETWGVRSMLLDADQHDALGDVAWRAPDHQVERIRHALTRATVAA